MATQQAQYLLHGYFRSTCSGRVRIALNLKGIQYDNKFLSIPKGEHQTEQYGAINPMKFLPSLQLQSGAILTQSLAIMDYLDEEHPETVQLLPPKSDLIGRAQVRALAALIACDVQPVTNERILKKVAAKDGSEKEWAKWLMDDGFGAYEKLAAPVAGKFSYGDTITLADICLVPAVWRSQRFGVDLNEYPTIKRVYEAMSKEPSVVEAHWQNQPDCPPELKN